MKTHRIATTYAILAAALYAVSIPLSKLILGYASPTITAAFLYLCAGLGILLYRIFLKGLGKSEQAKPLTKKEFPYAFACELKYLHNS